MASRSKRKQRFRLEHERTILAEFKKEWKPTAERIDKKISRLLELARTYDPLFLLSGLTMEHCVKLSADEKEHSKPQNPVTAGAMTGAAPLFGLDRFQDIQPGQALAAGARR